MIPPKGEWKSFSDEIDRLDHYKLWGLVPKSAKSVKPVIYCGFYTDRPTLCDVVGYVDDDVAVISISNSLHCIDGEHLADLQPKISQKLPRGMTFTDVLGKYVVLDIETTGLRRTNDRIIEIAAIKYEYGEEKESFTSLVNPQIKIPHKIATLTGISQDDVASAPCIESITSDFLGFIGDLPLIGHNIASFDIPFLSYHLSTDISNLLIDTLFLSKEAFPKLPSHKLADINSALELSDQVCHRALADVRTTNALLLACLSPKKCEAKVLEACVTDMKPLRDHTGSGSDQSASVPNESMKYKKTDPKSIVSTVPHIDNSNPLYEKSVVFTGELSISRREAMQIAVNCGAVVRTSVSKKTDYLVVGKQDKELVGEDGLSTKEEKAYALNDAGVASIKIVGEEEFLELAGMGVTV